MYEKKRRKKKMEEEKNKNKSKQKKNKKNKTEAFHSFFQAIVPAIIEMWTDRCIDRNTPVLGGRIVAEYDSLMKKVTQLYTMREMVLPEDELKIFEEPLEEKLQDTNQQLKKWITRWRPVIDHSMKRMKEIAKGNSKPIWQHFTATKPAKTIVTRRVSKRKNTRPRKMSNNPLTNVYNRMQKKRSSSRATIATKRRYTKTLITTTYTRQGKQRSTSRDKTVREVEEQKIEDRFGDVPM
jgi:hypothetical protein